MTSPERGFDIATLEEMKADLRKIFNECFPDWAEYGVNLEHNIGLVIRFFEQGATDAGLKRFLETNRLAFEMIPHPHWSSEDIGHTNAGFLAVIDRFKEVFKQKYSN